MSGKKRVDEFVRELEALPGVEVRIGKRSSHRKVYLHGRLVAVLPATPSDRRGWLNTRARLRRLGLVT